MGGVPRLEHAGGDEHSGDEVEGWRAQLVDIGGTDESADELDECGGAQHGDRAQEGAQTEGHQHVPLAESRRLGGAEWAVCSRRNPHLARPTRPPA